VLAAGLDTHSTDARTADQCTAGCGGRRVHRVRVHPPLPSASYALTAAAGVIQWRLQCLPNVNSSSADSALLMTGAISVVVLATCLCIQPVHAERAIKCICRYTALGMALALPADGKLIACDITDEYPSIGALPPRRKLVTAVQFPKCARKSASLELDGSMNNRCTGKPFWEKAGVTGKIDLRIAPAVDTMEALLKVRTLQLSLCARHGVGLAFIAW